ncbi:MAG: GSCFA domain-containing protein [Paraglaciecola sp.]
MANNKVHPYKNLPEKAFWRKSVSSLYISEVDPVDKFDLKIDLETKVATAGSCFAQHIARYLQNSGFNYFVAEKAHPLIPSTLAKEHNYGAFSARYGNIYTARQLVQLFDRAFGNFTPQETAWFDEDGTCRDPFRPNVQPSNFIHEAEMLADREQHLKCVKNMFETLDIFVFTLGLTETWISKVDGAVFPICPGTIGGDFDSGKYEFYNQTASDVVQDMTIFIDKLKEINSKAKVVLTVSPVPLMATAQENAHVLQATTYSKSVLRVAAEELRNKYEFVHYFPSFEIITGNFNRGKYYAKDLRNVIEPGVLHVMRLFLKHAAGVENLERNSEEPIKEVKNDFISKAEEVIDVECEEASLDRYADS